MEIPLEEYIKSTLSVNSDNYFIEQKARELTGLEKSVTERAKRLFYFVRDKIKYNLYSVSLFPWHYRASFILRSGEGYCVQKAVILAALLRAADIPSRLRFATLRSHLHPERTQEVLGNNLYVYHGYVELNIKGRWLKATPTFDLETCRKDRIIPVEFDGRTDAVFHSHDMDGKLHIEYLLDHGHFLDIPFREMKAARNQVYGAGVMTRLAMGNMLHNGK